MRILKKIRPSFGGLLMLSAMAISDSAPILGIYLAAALIHEIGHLTAAGLLRISVTEIRFEFSGVRICTDPRLTSYGNELLLALAGPLCSFLSAAAGILISIGQKNAPAELFVSAERFLNGEEQSLLGGLGFFVLSALIQGFSNFLPISTFDGGRVLNCFLAHCFGEDVANRTARALSFLSAFCLWTVALYLMLRVSAGLAVYTFAACIFFGIGREDRNQSVSSAGNTI